MCGIAGIFDSANAPGWRELEPMVSIQSHRGPDSSGHHVDGDIAMGMRRLSIIDVEGGDQPVFNEDRSVAVVFNGEIYNYLELREDLIARGHHFETRSDTEVLVHLYEECGNNMLARLNGMFSFAIWDGRRRRVLLARDRMGVKPLYFAQAGSRFYFASELKCILTQPGFGEDADLDLDAIADFLQLAYIPGARTPYKSIHKLLPGHSLSIDANGSVLWKWWDLADISHEEPTSAELEHLFNDSVKLRMRSDVPVASFLSGGLDSSLVTIVAQEQSNVPINTFTLGFEHTEFDETPYARSVAEWAHTAHRERIASPADAIEHLPKLMWHMDEPMGDSSIVPNYLISRFAAETVKVVLSGLGGDELFGGYARYLDPGKGRIRKLFGRTPGLAGLLAPPMDRFNFSWAEELRIASDRNSDWRAYLHRLQIFHAKSLDDLGFPSHGHAAVTIEDLWNRYPGDDPVSKRQFVDQHTYLPDEILALTDRMSMANSIEVRVPFMDYRLVRLSQNLSSKQKQNPREFKIFLKQALGKKCPPRILTRPKWGFDTPLQKWVASPELFNVIRQLDSGECVKSGLMSAAGVQALTATPETCRRNARKVWNLLVLEVWMRVRRRRSAPTETTEELLESAACGVH